MQDRINIPHNWQKQETFDLIQFDAGMAYIMDQYGMPSDHETVELRSEDGQAAYLLYPDDSLWFVNNAGDEVWSDYRVFVLDQLLPGIRANGLVWEKLSAMDRGMLAYYCDDDEKEARRMVEEISPSLTYTEDEIDEAVMGFMERHKCDDVDTCRKFHGGDGPVTGFRLSCGDGKDEKFGQWGK